ncbi:hypothetical protein HW132_00745 [Brasilonema sp. CT11]|nr:hypothetical protein [Brasilonema sp. CT11]
MRQMGSGLTHFNVIPSLRATAKQSPQGRDCFTPLRCVRNDILPCCVSSGVVETLKSDQLLGVEPEA